MTTRHSSIHLAGENQTVDTISTDSLGEMRELVATYAEDPNGAVLDGWEPGHGTIITEVRAISARINQNYDAWPSDELREAHHTFVGKPVFINHNNSDPDQARGRVVASRFVENGEDKFVQVLQEVEATRFPKLAKELMEGGLDSVSMGAEAREVECSFCANISTSPFDACEHIAMKGATLQRRTASGQPEDVLVYEICRKISFFELSYVFDPADETAVASNVLVASKGTSKWSSVRESHVSARVRLGLRGGKNFIKPTPWGEQVIDLLDRPGFTFQNLPDDGPSTGYMVSIDPQAEKIIPEMDVTTADLGEYIEIWASAALTDPNKYVGGWVHRGKLYLDVSTHVADLQEALSLARQYNQLGIYDLANDVEILTKDHPVTAGREAINDVVAPPKVDTLHPDEDEKSSDDWHEYVDDPNVIDTIDVLDEPDLGLNQQLERLDDDLPEGFEEFENIDQEIEENEEAERELAQESREQAEEKSETDEGSQDELFQPGDPEYDGDDNGDKGELFQGEDDKDPEDDENWDEEDDGTGGTTHRFKGSVDIMVSDDYGTVNMQVEKNGSLIASDTYPSLIEAKAAAVDVAKKHMKEKTMSRAGGKTRVARTSTRKTAYDRKQAGWSEMDSSNSGSLTGEQITFSDGSSASVVDSHSGSGSVWTLYDSEGEYITSGHMATAEEARATVEEYASGKGILASRKGKRKQAVDYTTGDMCIDCLMILANDDDSGMTAQQAAESRAGIADLRAQGIEPVPGDFVDPSFGTHPCEVCGTRLGGDRVPVNFLEGRSASRKTANDSIRQWLINEVRDFSIQKSLAEELWSESDDNANAEDWADYLDGAGHPELAEKIVQDLGGGTTASIKAFRQTSASKSKNRLAHNGWTNFETWQVVVILDNDQTAYEELGQGVSNVEHLRDIGEFYSQGNGIDFSQVNWQEIYDSYVEDGTITSRRRAHNGSNRLPHRNDRDISRKDSRMAPQRRRRTSGDNKQTPLLEETGISQTPAEEPAVDPEAGGDAPNNSESDRVKSARRALARELAIERARKARRRTAANYSEWSDFDLQEAHGEWENAYQDGDDSALDVMKEIEEEASNRGLDLYDPNFDPNERAFMSRRRRQARHQARRRQAGPVGADLSGDNVDREDLFENYPATTMTASKVRNRFAAWVQDNYGSSLRQASSQGELRSWARAFSKESGIKLPTLHAAIKRDVMALRTAESNEDEGVTGDPVEEFAKDPGDADDKKESRRRAVARRRAAQARNTRGRGRTSQTTRRRTADDKLDLAAPDDRVNVEAPTSGTTDDEAEASQFDKSDFDNNSGKGLEKPDTTGTPGTPGGPSVNDLSRSSSRATGLQAVRLAEAMIAAGLVENTTEAKFKAAAQFEQMSRDIVLDRTALLEKVAKVNTARRSSTTKNAGNRGSSLNSAVPPNMSAASRSATRQVEASADTDSDIFF